MHRYMHKHTRKKIWAFPLLLVFALTGCELFGPGPEPSVDAPVITSFTANPATITAPNQEVTLSWQLSGAVTSLTLEPGGAAVSGRGTIVTPSETTTYTLRASNSAGATTAQATVTFDDGVAPPPPPGLDPTPPMGNFAVGPTANGPFSNDRSESIVSPNDERVLQIDPGDTFFAQVSYSDPSGVTDIQVNLVNSNPPGISGSLDPGQNVSGFTLVGAVNSGCDLADAPTSVTCVYQIDVDDDVVNIDQLPDSGNEFAYVFRTNVTDSVGNVSDEAIRGYVVVGGASSPPPAPPEEPTPPEPEPPEEPAPPEPEPPEEPAPPEPEPPEEPEPVEGPVIESFTANGDEGETTVMAGDAVELAWELSGTEPEAITILVEEEGIGIPATPIEREVDDTSFEVESVEVTTTYTLVIEGTEGTEPAQGVVMVTVEEAP